MVFSVSERVALLTILSRTRCFTHEASCSSSSVAAWVPPYAAISCCAAAFTRRFFGHFGTVRINFL
jgi:hypothetical protein